MSDALQPGNRLPALMALIAFLLPFEYLPTLPVSGLNIRLSTAAGAVLIAITAWQLITGQLKLTFDWPRALMVAWLVWLVIGLGMASNLSEGLKDLLPLAFLVLLTLSFSRQLKTDYLPMLARAVLLGALASAIFGIYQFFGNRAGLSQHLTGLRPEYSWERFGFPRMQSVALEPLYYSAFLLLPIMLLVLLLVRRPEFRRWYYFALLALLLLVDVLTLSRGGLAALVLGLLVVAVMVALAFGRQLARQLALGFAGLVLVFGLALLTIAAVARPGHDKDVTYGKQGTGSALSHLADFHFSPSNTNKAKNDSISQRDAARQQAADDLKGSTKVLLVGTGIGQYHAYTQSHYSNPKPGEPNNVVLEQLVQTGIIGFGLLVALVLLLLGGLWRQARHNGNDFVRIFAITAFALLVALAFQAQTFTGLVLTHLWFTIGICLFLVQLPLKEHKRHAQSQKKNQQTP